MMLHVSISSMSDFMTCRRLYYWKRIKRYDRVIFSVPFLVGRVVHDGIGSLISTKSVDKALLAVKEAYARELKVVKNTVVLTQDQKEDLAEQEYVTRAMVEAYASRYRKMIASAEHLDNEVGGKIRLSDKVMFVFKLDNLLQVRGKKILHELKTSKYITPDYIRHVQTDRQTASYFYLYNMVYKKNPINEIMYDVVRKPSIRQKKNESYQAYLVRLKEWYQKPDEMSVFHIERFSKPIIGEMDMLNTIEKVSYEMLRCRDSSDYYQNTEHCHSYYGNRCPYYELCHEGGETKQNLVLYQPRKRYEVKGSTKG